MAKKTAEKVSNSDTEDFTASLIKDINKERGGDIVAYNLSSDISPTHVKRWISTGCRSLDYICSNRRDGGLPESRIVEIFGDPSIGKSHVAAQICKSAQKMGGIAVYIDSETATSVENLSRLGVDVRKGFVYVSEHCTENILSIAESTIMKARAMKKDVPIVIVWDSVAASSPKAELEGDYDKETIGLQARTISKGMRKITGVLANQNILFVILNQMRKKIGVMFGDPDTTPGGSSIPFHSSVRIKLSGGTQILNDQKEVIGINVIAKTIKNKVAMPFRRVNFQIHFGIGIREHEELFDLMREHGPETIKGLVHELSGLGGWKRFAVFDPTLPENSDPSDPKVCLVDKKFTKTNFKELWDDPKYKEHLEDLLEIVMVRKLNDEPPDIDPESYIEISALAAEIGEQTGDLEGLSL